MEGWGKELGKLSVPCLSEFILNFEGDCDFSFFLEVETILCVDTKQKCDYVWFSFSIVLFLLLFIVLMSSFKKGKEEKKKGLPSKGRLDLIPEWLEARSLAFRNHSRFHCGLNLPQRRCLFWKRWSQDLPCPPQEVPLNRSPPGLALKNYMHVMSYLLIR